MQPRLLLLIQMMMYKFVGTIAQPVQVQCMPLCGSKENVAVYTLAMLEHARVDLKMIMSIII